MIQILETLWRSQSRQQMLKAGGVLSVVVLVCVTALLGTLASRADAIVEYDAEQASWSGNSAAAEELAVLNANLAQREKRASELKQAGFGSAADRVAWVEGAVATLNKLHTIGYTVEVETAQVQPLSESLQVWYVDRALEPPVYEVNNLSLKVQGVHEDEFLQLIDRIAAVGGGVVRTEHCKLERRVDGLGINIDCSLRRYRIRQSLPAAAS
jgi:hypothetical protein